MHKLIIIYKDKLLSQFIEIKCLYGMSVAHYGPSV